MRLLNRERTRECLTKFDFERLFIEELGWDHLTETFDLTLDGKTFKLAAVAHKRGMVAFVSSPGSDGGVPEYRTRRRIDNRIRNLYHEHFIIYTNAEKTVQVWQWVKREAGKPAASREHRFYVNQSGEPLMQKLQTIAFSIEEEEGLNIVDSSGRVRTAFDTKPVTKRFYDGFKTKRDEFHSFLEGVPTEEMKSWYVSVMLNRLMFIYFIQKKGFLNDDQDYLLTKLGQSKRRGRDRYYRDFLCRLFFEGFAKREAERSQADRELLGKVPFLNGGLFMRHEIEQLHGEEILIADAAFDRLFAFFEEWRWHLDERPLRSDKEINPDILGYVYEKYINQKQMGAYYTKEDITGYISRNTVIPFLFDAAKKDCKIAFEGDSSVWRLLQEDPDRYIYDAMRKGVDLPLPEDIALGISDVSKRTYWNKAADEEYRLPTEIWRETVARRQRCEEVRAKLRNGEVREINDLITLNLNIEQFAEDVIDNCEGSDLLRAFWKAINSVSVLDPACGSGAFLFAAMNILECLYEACLNRMRCFIEELDASGEKHRPDKFKVFRDTLDAVARHPNEKYFIFKSIVLNNLYGVDIMDEAVEICKLRLFLKLVAQVESVEDIEPLPDIDFNIRAGNSLVGFATYGDAKAQIKADLALGRALEEIEEDARGLEGVIGQFRKQQTEIGGEITIENKEVVADRLKGLSLRLDRILGEQYGEGPRDPVAFQGWRDSHKPFHWFIEFHEIMNRGGFDVIIGNPPYVEYAKVKDEYKIEGYQTEKCGNLYAFMMDRSIAILRPNCLFGMILPIGMVSTERMDPLQTILKQHESYLSHYSGDRNPAEMFDGVKMRLTICILRKNSAGCVWSTGYNKWYTEARKELFPCLSYAEVTEIPGLATIPKVAPGMQSTVFRKVIGSGPGLGSRCSSGRGEFYFHNGPIFWVKALTFVPFFWSERDGQKPSTQLKPIWVGDDTSTRATVAMMNSSLFFMYFICTSDIRHLNLRDIAAYCFDPTCLADDCRPALLECCERLMRAYKSIATIKDVNYATTGRVRYEEIDPKLCKPVIDEIDRVLARHYGFTDEELDFIINYDIKYRMGWGAGGEPEEEP